jgi:basic membrane protein A
VIQAAHERGLWAIGVDSDQYRMADPSVRGAILTSMLKRADVALYTITMEVANGVPKDGNNVFGLDRGGVGYSTSGGFLDPITTQLDAFAAIIASGEILVPRKP